MTKKQTYVVSSIKPDRRLYLNDVILDSEEKAEAFIKLIYDLNDIDQNKPILIYIDSKGGCFWKGLDIYDACRLTEAQVIGFVVGKAFSTALTILQGCNLRIATKHSRFVIHDPENEMSFKIFPDTDISRVKQAINEEKRELKKKMDLVLNIFKLATGKSLKELKELSKKSKVLWTSEALKLNFIDEVI